jgi:RNA polymerase sigma-70 factor (ECF subfamily)
MSTPLHATNLLAELPRLRRYARVLTGDPRLADGLVEETLLRFRRRVSEASEQSNRSLDLLALLRCVNAEKTAAGARMALPGTGFSRPARWVQGRSGSAKPLPDRAAEMFAQLGELPLEQREVLVLVAVERLSYSDIATLLRIPVATVVSRLSQAREALHAVSMRPRSAPNNAG